MPQKTATQPLLILGYPEATQAHCICTYDDARVLGMRNSSRT